jgi:ATP-dependent 26S proteasome regulatory subunit
MAFLPQPLRYHNVGLVFRGSFCWWDRQGPGKTLLARAVTGEAGSTVLSLSASEFVEMFVGGTEKDESWILAELMRTADRFRNPYPKVVVSFAKV